MKTTSLRVQSSGADPKARRRLWLGIGYCAIVLELAFIAYLLWTGPWFMRTAHHGFSVGQLVPPPAPDLPPMVEPASNPAALRLLTTPEAEAINAAIPISTLPNPAARPFSIGKAAPADVADSLECLTAAIYYEAASESDDGQRAVAQVVLNRMRHPIFPHTVCGVVYQGHERSTGCQFSFTCDGSLARIPVPFGWKRAETIARDALNGHVYDKIGWATHYHTFQVVPYWATSLVKLTQVGAHIFYRWQGRWGGPQAFSSTYTGGETAAAAPPVPVVADGTPTIVPHLDRPVLANAVDGPLPTTVPDARSGRLIGLSERPIIQPGQPPSAAGMDQKRGSDGSSQP